MEIQLLRADIASLKVDAIVAPSDPAEAGRAIVVTGGNLLARFIIHVHVPNGDEDDADELAVASVGLPAIATGPFGFTSERCARVMLPVALDHRSRARSLRRAVFCLFGAEEYAAFERVLGELQP